MIEVSRVVVSQGFEVVAYADAAANALTFKLESSTGQVFTITTADARALLDMRLARK